MSFINHYKVNDDNYNFLSLIGGKYNITNINEFYKNYKKAIENGEYLYLVEKVFYPCKFYIDIDKNEMYEGIINKVCEIFNEYEIIICVCNENQGIHLIFQNLMINSPSDAIQILKKQNLNFDMSVYNTGLRLIGSRKPNLNRIYMPKFKYVNKQLTSLEGKCNLKIIKQCAINLAGVQNNNKIKVLQIPRILNVQRNDILHILHKNYIDTKIYKVFESNDKIYIYTDSKYCMNLCGYHKNNKVYFVMQYGEIYQKCFCKCDVKRQYTYCKYYNSHKVNLPLEMIYDIKDMCKT